MNSRRSLGIVLGLCGVLACMPTHTEEPEGEDASVTTDAIAPDAVTPDAVAPKDGFDAGDPGKPFVPGPNPKNVPMFDESRIVRFDLGFEDAAWQQLMNYWKSGVECDDTCKEGAQPCEIKTWVHCSFAFEGETFDDAACHLKGASFAWHAEKKPQLVVRFNKWNKQGRFLGLRRVNLEAAPYVLAPVRDRVVMWLMREAGIDAPRVNHAVVYRNGELLGLYMNIEALDREFLEDHFEHADGNLYKNGCELVTNEETNDYQSVWDLDWYVDQEPLTGDHEKFFGQVDALMDVDQVLLEAAAEMVLPTGDNFSNGSWNFYYYNHPIRGLMVLPWDLDGAMGEFAPVDSDPFAFVSPPEVDTPPNKLLLLVVQKPQWKDAYVSNLIRLRDGIYQKLPGRIDFVCQQIRDAYAKDPGKNGTVEEFDTECALLKQVVADRTAFLKKAMEN